MITTAAVPGRKAPVLMTTQMVEGMAEGAVVVDMAADQGGNCELTVAGEIVDHGGVHVVGMANPPSGMPTHASFLFSRNVANGLGLMGPEGTWRPTGTTRSCPACACCVTAPGGAGRGGAVGRKTQGAGT